MMLQQTQASRAGSDGFLCCLALLQLKEVVSPCKALLHIMPG